MATDDESPPPTSQVATRVVSRPGPTRRGAPPSEAGTPPREALQPEVGLLITDHLRLARPLASGGMASVWIADHLALDHEVAVKFVLVNEDVQLRERLSREAQLAARIDHPHAVRTFDRGALADGTPFLVMELLDGVTLAERLEADGPMPPDDVERMISQLAGALGHAHELGIVHRDVKPHNIMLLASPPELFAKLLDFGIAKPLRDEGVTTLTKQGELIGTPVYMAPEQLIEARPANEQADLWSLAVVAYEALTGHRPFRGTRAAVGAQMVLQRFAPVTTAQPGLPAALDDWMRRAFHMDPEQRFASTEELVETFRAAIADTSRGAQSAPAPDGRLRIPERLYGRDAELAQAFDAFELAAKGRPRLLLIGGFAGIGKTSLVREIHERMLTRGAVFAGGKFDQFNRGVPYEGIVRAFRVLVRTVLARDEAALETARRRIAGQLRGAGAALVAAIPEVEALIGPQPAPADVPPNEARNRFHSALGALLRAIASPDSPVVIFLDDLQWADLSSIELINRLLSDPETQHVLFVGAYRDNEVSDTHPLTTAVSVIRTTGVPVDAVQLGPLGEDAVLELITDTLGTSPGRARLSLECLRQTRGNPFFLKRFLESLHEDGMFTLGTDGSHWEWDFTAIAARPIEDSVVEFICAEIDRMEPLSGRALSIAACIGDRFELTLLASMLGVGRSEAITALGAGLSAELVVAGGEDPWMPGLTAAGSSAMWFRFAHDRVRQAARQRLSDHEAGEIHGTVALRLLATLTGAQQEQRLFELVEHLNRATKNDGIDAPTLRELNLAAARRANASAAFEAAHGYYQRALRHLPADPWRTDQAATVALHLEAAQAAYLTGAHDTMDALVEQTTEHAENLLDRIRAEEVRIHAHVSQQRFTEAIALTLRVLGELGIPIAEDSSPQDAQAAVGETLGALQKAGPEVIAALERGQSRELALALRIQNGAMSTAYLTAPNLLPILASNIVRTTLEQGLFDESPYGFAVFALILNAGNLIDISYDTGKMAERMLEVVDVRAVEPKTLHVLGTHVYPFVTPVLDNVAWEQRVYERAMDIGDLEYAAWAAHNMLCLGFFGGMPLSELSELVDRNMAVLEFHQQLPALGCSLQMAQLVRNLTGPTADPSRLIGDAYDEAVHRAELESTGFRGGLYVLTVAATTARFFFGDLDGAIEVADGGAAYVDGCVATYHPVWWNQMRALAVLGRVRPGSAGSAESAEAALLSVAPQLQQLETWRKFSERNHAHRVHLVGAEVARVEDRASDAMDLYDRAIQHAKAHGFTHEAALANELAACLHADRDSQTPARGYMAEARRLYEVWGASAKVAQLDEAWKGTLL